MMKLGPCYIVDSFHFPFWVNDTSSSMDLFYNDHCNFSFMGLTMLEPDRRKDMKPQQLLILALPSCVKARRINLKSRHKLNNLISDS